MYVRSKLRKEGKATMTRQVKPKKASALALLDEIIKERHAENAEETEKGLAVIEDARLTPYELSILAYLRRPTDTIDVIRGRVEGILKERHAENAEETEKGLAVIEDARLTPYELNILADLRRPTDTIDIIRGRVEGILAMRQAFSSSIH